MFILASQKSACNNAELDKLRADKLNIHCEKPKHNSLKDCVIINN